MNQKGDLVEASNAILDLHLLLTPSTINFQFQDLNIHSLEPFSLLNSEFIDVSPVTYRTPHSFFDDFQSVLPEPLPVPPSTFVPYLNLSISLESPIPYLEGLVSDGPLPGFVPFPFSFEPFVFEQSQFDFEGSSFENDDLPVFENEQELPNQSPVTGPDALLNTLEDTTLPLGLTSPTDPDGDPLTVTVTTLPAGGIVRVPGNPALNNGDTLTTAEVALLEFVPNADFNGNAGQLQLEVSDDSATVTQTISLDVTPVNDAPSDIILSNHTIGENASPGDVVGTLSAVDIDSAGPFTYTLIGGATDKFDLVGNSLRVKAGANLDHETLDQHTLSIEVEDPDGATYTENLQIKVTNDFEASVGSITANHNIQTISFTESYTNPVVFAFLSTTNGGDQSIARVQNVTETSFQVYVDEAPNKNGPHINETINYFVAEAGKWELSDGTLFEVGTYDMNHVTRASGFETLSFSHDFSVAPIVLTQVQTTENGIDFLKNRQRNTTKDEIELALEPAENINQIDLISDETIGYFAVEDITGNWGGNLFESGLTSDSVTHGNFVVSYDQAYTGGDSIFLGSIATFDGSDSSQLRGRGSNGTSQTIFVEEDTTKDGELNHTTERASYIVFDEEDTSLGESASAVAYSIDVSDGFTLINFGNVTFNNFSTSQILNLNDMLDVNSDGLYNSVDLSFLESSGELLITDDGTNVTLDFSVGTQTGGVLVLGGLSQSASQPINTVDDLINQVQVTITP